jgi:hypothetical protein
MKLIRVGELGRFLRQQARLREKFDIPTDPAAPALGQAMTSATGEFRVDWQATHPKTLKACHKALDEMCGSIKALRVELNVALARLSELEPMAENYKVLRAKLSSGGKKGGRPPGTVCADKKRRRNLE